MYAEWSAECSAEDPILLVPWRDDEGSARFIDLRAEPFDLYLIPEAETHPPLLQALRALNASRSPVFTAKCDAWPLDPDELDSLALHLDVVHDAAQSGFASYVDLVWRERAIFVSRHRQEQILDRLTRIAAGIRGPAAALECVLRPCMLDFGETMEGFAATLYVKALGADPAHAYDEWGHGLREVVRLIRGREFASRQAPLIRTPRPAHPVQ